MFSFKDMITDLFKLKDEAMLEAVFGDLDRSKQGYVDANEILMILKNCVDQLYRIRGDGFLRELDALIDMHDSGWDKRIKLDDFKRFMLSFHVNRDFQPSEVSSVSQSRRERYDIPTAVRYPGTGSPYFQFDRRNTNTERSQKNFFAPLHPDLHSVKLEAETW